MRKIILVNLALVVGISIGYSQTKNSKKEVAKNEVQTKQDVVDNEPLQWFTDLQKANELMQHCILHFYDKESGMFYFTTDEGTEFKSGDACIAAPFTNKYTNSLKCGKSI